MISGRTDFFSLSCICVRYVAEFQPLECGRKRHEPFLGLVTKPFVRISSYSSPFSLAEAAIHLLTSDVDFSDLRCTVCKVPVSLN